MDRRRFIKTLSLGAAAVTIPGCIGVSELLSGGKKAARLEMLEDFLKACRDAMFKVVDWILEYSPIGVLALTIMNFGLYGPKIVDILSPIK